MSEHDPRVDPQPGDIVEKQGDRGTIRRRVLELLTIYGPGVKYETTQRGVNKRVRSCCLETWRRWARDAEAL